MEEPIEETYFKWLCAKVMPRHSDNYYGLLLVLHKTEFVWTIHGDHNRAAEGIELRLYFLHETNLMQERLWFEQQASVLEVLLALANRAEFQTDISVAEWFWMFIKNLGLDDYRRISDAEISVIGDIVNRFIWRTFEPNGRGGLFPLQEPHRDQRKVEIWYQFCDYVEDQGLL